MPKRLIKKLYRCYLCDMLNRLEEMTEDPAPVTRDTKLRFMDLQFELIREVYKLDNDQNGGAFVMFTAPKQ